MQIANLLSSYKSEAPLRDTGWRSQALKDKAVKLRLEGNSLMRISELLFISPDTATGWCSGITGTYKPIPSQEKELRKEQLVELLSTGINYTRIELAEKIGVSKRTIRSYINEIKDGNHEYIQRSL